MKMGQESQPIIAPKFRATASSKGIWSPHTKSDCSIKHSCDSEAKNKHHQQSNQQHPPTPPSPPIWTPRSADPSPVLDRKEFRPVKFTSPVPERKFIAKQETPAPPPPPWHSINSQPIQQSRSCSNVFGTTLRSQNPTIQLLQKAREVQLPRSGSNYMETSQQQKFSQNTATRNKVLPNEVLYTVKREYLSEAESENEKPRKMVELAPRKFEGIGPTTKDGMPIVLRSEVNDENQHKWYKRMYDTLHKNKHEDEYVTVRYKTRRGRYPYKVCGYMSEPEPNYDSDYSVKYNTLDRRRHISTSHADDKTYGTMPNPIKSVPSQYKNQPGKIENYITGHSSISDKEKKENFEQEKHVPRSYTEGYLSRALKDTGYESDSNLIFRKKEQSFNTTLSPIEQKTVYKSVQAGGEPPLHGFRKPAPEKPKETTVVPPPPPPPKGVPLNLSDQFPESPRRYVEGDVNIHYRTPIRYELKEPIPEDELSYRQAEAMKKLYQEERRRKYLQELQDMNNRRHTDNFTQSQKSPISLHRYDDFGADLSPKSPVQSKTVARALYNFVGQTARELNFKKGDIIYIRRAVDKNWYEGEHNACIGLLPVSYVEVVSKDGIRAPAPKKLAEGQARAKYNFQAQSAIELSLNKGELVTLTRRVDDNWFEGRIANRKGIFPVSYVDVLMDIGAADQPKVVTHPLAIAPRTHSEAATNGHSTYPQNGVVREMKTMQKTEVLHVDTNSEPVAYRALYKYRPQNNDELELQEGDIVYVLEKCDDGWFVGTSQRSGYFGTFPGNYVERV